MRLSESVADRSAAAADAARRLPGAVADRSAAAAHSARRFPGAIAAHGADAADTARRLPGTFAGYGADAALATREALTRRRLAWIAAALITFAVPFAANAARDDSPAPPAAVLATPAQGVAPAPPRLREVAALPQPPRIEPRRPPSVAVAAPPPTIAPIPTPAAVAPVTPAPAPAPAPAPQPPPETFDLEG